MDPPSMRRAPRRRREQDSQLPPSIVRSHNDRYVMGTRSNGDSEQSTVVQMQHHHQIIPSCSHTRRQSLRRRGGSSLSNDNQALNSNDSYIDCQDNAALSDTPFSSSHNTRRAIHSRLARVITLLIICLLMFYGVEVCLKTVISAIKLVFRSSGHSKEKKQHEGLDSIDKSRLGLRGSTDIDASSAVNGGMSLHDLNAISHQLKAEGQQLIRDNPIEDITTAADDEEKVSEGYEVYMGHDSTTDYFFAGQVQETKKIVNSKGRIETISFPAHTYATLPFLVDSNPFALSVWVYLSPVSERLESDTLEDSRTTRVILSTLTKDDSGCTSDIFGGPSSGIVLYAQPHYDDSSSDNEKLYRIMLEIASTESNVCRTVGLNKDALLVGEGQWNHISIFITRVNKSEIEADNGEERISLYVGGDLSGRNYVSGRLRDRNGIETYVGGIKDTTPSKQKSSKYFGLGGRVAMLSFWEIGGPASSVSISERMQIKSMIDEDHVTRAINRAGFDIRAIQELSLQGLTVKEPNLLYTFDGQDDQTKDKQLYDQQTNVNVKEVVKGKNGSIFIEETDGALINTNKFVPLGGNRYAEYRDGTYQPPVWTDMERAEFGEIAFARSVIVKKAMEHAWSGYKKYAWGKDELLPLSNIGQDNWGGMGTTLIDSLSTLWIMDMKDEFYEARDWVRDSLDFDSVEGGVSVFETTIRVLGGLLSAYDLSDDPIFKWAADDLGQRLIKAFKTKSSIPFGEVELKGGKAYNTGWHSNSAVLSEIGTLQLEFRFLARVTGRTEYATEAMRALDELLKIETQDGLFPTMISNLHQRATFANDEVSFGAMGDSFYEYLLKIWLQGGKKEAKYRQLYDAAVKGMMDKLVHISRPTYLTYVAELKYGKVIHKMDHLSCFLGGNLALGAYTHPEGLHSKEAQMQLKTGKQLAYTCYQMYARQSSGLSPEYVDFRNGKSDFEKGLDAPYYLLRPEVSETMFILWHLTKDPVYREWGWEIFQAIEEQTKTDSAYAAIKDIDTLEKDDRMESFFLAETLKYLYLLQNDDHDIDLLNTHVFNTEAHPLTLLSFK